MGRAVGLNNDLENLDQVVNLSEFGFSPEKWNRNNNRILFLYNFYNL